MYGIFPESTSFSYLMKPSKFAEDGICLTVSSQIMIQSSSWALLGALSMRLVLGWLRISANSALRCSYELKTVSSFSSLILKRRLVDARVDESIGESLAESVVENCKLDGELFPPTTVVVWQFSLECWAAETNDLFFQWFYSILVL